MFLSSEYQPEQLLLTDAYLGNGVAFLKKLEYLAQFAQPEEWEYNQQVNKQYSILKNYIFYTYERVKQEGKIAIEGDNDYMCFNTGLQTIHECDIYAYFVKNNNENRKDNQLWYLQGFKQSTDRELQCFSKLPDIADYFTNPADFIYDKTMSIEVDYDHIIGDNYDRFVEIGVTDEFLIKSLLMSGVNKIVDKVRRNYKLAIPQFYTDKYTNESKIQLLLPLYMKSSNSADLALVVDKGRHRYIAKTILPLEWAYVNSRRIIKPDVEWLNIK